MFEGSFVSRRSAMTLSSCAVLFPSPDSIILRREGFKSSSEGDKVHKPSSWAFNIVDCEADIFEGGDLTLVERRAVALEPKSEAKRRVRIM
mgnify:CR=1 FL=1